MQSIGCFSQRKNWVQKAVHGLTVAKKSHWWLVCKHKPWSFAWIHPLSFPLWQWRHSTFSVHLWATYISCSTRKRTASSCFVSAQPWDLSSGRLFQQLVPHSLPPDVSCRCRPSRRLWQPSTNRRKFKIWIRVFKITYMLPVVSKCELFALGSLSASGIHSWLPHLLPGLKQSLCRRCICGTSPKSSACTIALLIAI